MSAIAKQEDTSQKKTMKVRRDTTTLEWGPTCSRGQTALRNEINWGLRTQSQRLSAIFKHAKHEDRILDLGAGRGAYVSALTKSGFSVVGFDLNLYPEWIVADQESFVVGTGKELPFANKTFGTTIAFEVLEHIPDPIHAFREIIRCTKNQLIFSVPNCDINNNLRKYDLAMAHWTDPTHCNFFTKRTILALLYDLDLKVVEMIDCYKISPNAYFWGTIRLPRRISSVLRRLCDRLNLTETYWSSILVVASISH